MELILDLLIVLIVVLTVYAGYKNGFFKTVAGLFGGIISFFVARLAASLLAPRLASLMPVSDLGDQLTGTINSALLESDASLTVLGLLEKIGLPKSLLSNLTADAGQALAGAAGSAADKVALALTELFCFCVIFLIAFILCAVLIRLLFVWLDVFSHLPVIATLNSLLGCLCGVLAGLFFAWMLAIVLNWLGPVLATSFDIDLSAIDLSRTFIFQYFAAFNPLQLLFSIK